MSGQRLFRVLLFWFLVIAGPAVAVAQSGTVGS
jgi:hypothetical protein